MSLVFSLLEHHVIMVHFTLADIGVTSLCSHDIHIMLMASSHSHHDFIATCVNHDYSQGR